jgi:hypothetical protein
LSPKPASFNSFIGDSSKEVSELQNNYNAHLNFLKKSQSTLDYLANLCDRGYSTELINTDKIKSLANDFEQLKFFKENKLSSVLATLIENLDSTDASKHKLEFGLLQDLNQELGNLSCATYQIEYTKMYASLLSFENWQGDYLKNNQTIASKVVFISKVQA